MTRSLATLLRLRRLDLQSATRGLAEALAVEADAAARAAEAKAALRHEAAMLDASELARLENFAAWLPKGTEVRRLADEARTAAADATALARQGLARQRAALKAAEALAAERVRMDGKASSRRSAHALDDLVRANRTGR